jgi:small subunit ribosomal protein S21
MRNKHDNTRSVSVEVYNNDIEGALRRLKRKLKKDNFYVEIKKREFYLKPSLERKLKKRRKKSISGEEL